MAKSHLEYKKRNYSLETLARIEETALSNWLRESGLAFFTSLSLHSLGMAFVVGINIAIGLRLVGFAPQLSIAPLVRFYPLHWYCAAIMFVSGLALLLAYPAKALTNPVFYAKFAALLIALGISRKFQQSLAADDLDIEQDVTIKRLAYLSLALWVITITAGRFLAYTHSILLASRFY